MQKFSYIFVMKNITLSRGINQINLVRFLTELAKPIIDPYLLRLKERIEDVCLDEPSFDLDQKPLIDAL